MIMDFLLFAVAIGVLILSGLITLNFMEKGEGSDFGIGVRFAVSFMLGLGIVSLQMFFYSTLSIPFGFFSIALPWVALTAFSFLSLEWRDSFFTRLKGTDLSRWRNIAWYEWILLLIMVSQIVYTFVYALLMPVSGWDALGIWFFKARGFFWERKVSVSFLLNNPAHPDYPLLIPLSIAWIYTSMGKINDHLAKILYPLQYVSLLIIFYYLLRKISSRKNALFFTTLLSLTPLLLIHAGGLPVSLGELYSGDFVGYADITLSVYFMGFCGFLYLYLLNRNRGFLAIAVLFLGMGAWTKNEGLTFAMIGVCFIALCCSKELMSNRLFFLKTAGMLSVVVMPWFIYKLYLGISSEYLGNINLSVISGNTNRLSVILKKTGEFMFGKIALFNFTWYGYALLSLINWRGFLHRPLSVLQAMFVSQLFVYITVYMITPHDIVWHLNTSLDRLLLHLTPLAMLITAVNVWQKFESDKAQF